MFWDERHILLDRDLSFMFFWVGSLGLAGFDSVGGLFNAASYSEAQGTSIYSATGAESQTCAQVPWVKLS